MSIVVKKEEQELEVFFSRIDLACDQGATFGSMLVLLSEIIAGII